MEEILKKICKDCGVEKDVGEFYKNSYIRNGIASSCKVCYEKVRSVKRLEKKKELAIKSDFPNEKVCTVCNILKNKEDFYLDPTHSTELSPRCIECNRKKTKIRDDIRRAPEREARRLAEEEEAKLVGDGKRCSVCNIIKEKDKFHKHKRMKDGYCAYCIECEKIADRAYLNKNKEKNKDKQYDLNAPKICKSCKIEKKMMDFTKNLTNPDGLDNRCKQCKANDRQEYYLKCNAQVLISNFSDVDLKICGKCEINKMRADFYENKGSPDGLLSVCIDCCKTRSNVSTNGRARSTYMKNFKAISEYEIDTLIENSQYKCFYCSVDIRTDGIKMHLDHKIPIKRGGPHIVGNLAVSCSKCNLHKGTMTDVEYKEYLKLKENMRKIMIIKTGDNQSINLIDAQDLDNQGCEETKKTIDKAIEKINKELNKEKLTKE